MSTSLGRKALAPEVAGDDDGDGGEPGGEEAPKQGVFALFNFAQRAAGEHVAGGAVVEADDDGGDPDAFGRLPGDPVLGVRLHIIDDAARQDRRHIR